MTPAMVSLEKLVKFLDAELKTAMIPDYPGALNGLQLANSGEVTRIVAAVDVDRLLLALTLAAGAVAEPTVIGELEESA